MTSPARSDGTDKVGVLFKRSDYLKEWKPRHFVLSPPQLRYCLPDSPNRVHKSLDLTMCRIERGEKTQWGGHALHTLVVSKPGAGVSYTLGSLRQEDAEAWVTALKVAARDATRAFVNQYHKSTVPQERPVEPTHRVTPTPPPEETKQVPEVRQEEPPKESAGNHHRTAPLAADKPATFLVFLLPSVCYAVCKAAPAPLYDLRGLAFLVTLALLLAMGGHPGRVPKVSKVD